jgi:hypothetical protein
MQRDNNLGAWVPFHAWVPRWAVAELSALELDKGLNMQITDQLANLAP